MIVLLSEYAATGEGHTIAMLVTNRFTGRLAHDRFKELFGDFISIGVRELNEDEFQRYVNMNIVPAIVYRQLNSECGFEWYSELHVNCS